MKLTRRLAAMALLALAAGCADHDPPDRPGGGDAIAGPAASQPEERPAEARQLEHQARRLARALDDPAFRQYLQAELAASPVVEHKLQFQRFLARDDRRAVEAMAAPDREDPRNVIAEADAGLAAEVYFPVPGHLERWAGGPDLLVATAIADRDVPVAFDTRGRRILLDPDTPPDTPVLAIVPQETDFDRPGRPQGTICAFEECGSGGGGSGGGAGGGSGGPGGTPPVQDLYLTRAQFVDTFEGWLKGNPEFELHVLGPVAGGDSTALTSYQCVGEHAPTGYFWDMNSTSWSGAAKVFTQQQMDALEQAHPGRSYLIMALEDDDTACEIKMGGERVGDLLTSLKNAYQSVIGLKDIQVVTINGVTRIITAAKNGASLISALANVIKTNDDLIGMAIVDSVVGRASPVGHWAVMNGGTKLNGWLNLEMR